MPTPLASRKAVLAKGALTAYLRPKLLPGTVLALDSILGNVNGANWKTQKPLVLGAVEALVTPKLAQDADLKDMTAFLGALDEDMEAEDEEDDDEEVKKKKAAEDKRAKDAAMKAAKDKAARDKKAKDEESETEEEKRERMEREKEEAEDKRAKDGKAMDAAIADAKREIREQMTAAAQAREFVRPIVGNVDLALDTADSIYAFALKAHKIDVKGVDPSAYRAMVGMLPKPGSQHQRPVPLAMDRANADSLHSMFPALSRISHS